MSFIELERQKTKDQQMQTHSHKTEGKGRNQTFVRMGINLFKTIHFPFPLMSSDVSVSVV